MGILTLSVPCTIDTNTLWGNGTLTIAGDIQVNSGIRLTLWNIIVRLNPSFDQQYRFYLNGGQLYVRYGTLTSANSAFGWRLETTTGSAVLVDIDRTNVSYVGSGASSGFLIQGGNGHRFRHLTVTNSALGSSSGVIDLNGGSLSDIRVENSTFSNTGTALVVHYIGSANDVVVRDNTVSSFGGSAGKPVMFAKNTQIFNNIISAGSSPGIQLWGGGPGWPSKNRNNVSGNTITTTGDAITTSGSAGYDVTWNTIFGGHVAFDGNGNRFAYNNITGTDARTSPGHIVTTSANSSFDHNTLWNVALTSDSGFLVMNYGNSRVTDNRLVLGCYGNNCMGIEVINVQAVQRPIYPGFPTVEVARNQLTWTTIGPGAITIFLDNEYSEREYLHNNTEIVKASRAATSSLQGGGVRDSVYENNTIFGPTGFCIYEYIYPDAGNLFQYNRCDGGSYAGIFQTGGNTYRSNTFTNLASAGIWLCPNSPCAGSNTKSLNNAWYNNTFTFAAGTYLTRMDPGNMLDNTFLGHGGTQWTDGANAHPIFGDWLFFTKNTISHLGFVNTPDGHRTLEVVAGGIRFWDRLSQPSVADSASLALDGTIDNHGSLNGGTVLHSFDPSATSSLDVTGSGIAQVTLDHFQPNFVYAITAKNRNTGSSLGFNITLDSTGHGVFSVDLGPTMTPFVLTAVKGASLPGSDTIPPAQVLDLGSVLVGQTYADIQWMAPGDNGTQGRASQYDLRFSTQGPLNDTNFGSGTPVVTPIPQPAGTMERMNVTNLLNGTRYWFAIRTADSVPNWSPVSNSMAITTLGPNQTPPPIGPAVLSVQYLPLALRLDVTFSEAMNQSSVASALFIRPAANYVITWLNASHLQIDFVSNLTPMQDYGLTIGSTATNERGQAMASPFSFHFTVPSNSAPPPESPWQSPLLNPFSGDPVAMWLWSVLILAAVSATAICLAWRSQRKVRKLRHTTGLLAERIDRLRVENTQPTPPRYRSR